MEGPVAEIADVLPTSVEFGLILLRRGGVGKRVPGKVGADASAGVAIVEKTRPEAEGKLGHDAPRGERFPAFSQSVFCFHYLLLLPSSEPCQRRIIPRI